MDATFGGGGHTRRLLASLASDVKILALDRDPAAAALARGLGPRVVFVQSNFRYLQRAAEGEGIGELSGALFDLGLSSLQLDDPSRGFSYRRPGPLDMRMGEGDLTAADIVNTWPAVDLAHVIRAYGEEPSARRIAEGIVAARPLTGTVELAEAVAAALPAPARRKRKGHPARRTFQALRIAVNDELASFEEGLEAAIGLLRPGGRVVVISYHSLEDRIAKRRFAAGTGVDDNIDMPVPPDSSAPELRLLTRKAMRPSPAEVDGNRRARSARLRAAEKLAAS